MRLIDGGKSFVWGEGEERWIDDQVLKLQRRYSKDGLSIWGTPDCSRCGACCYLPEKVNTPQLRKCEYLTTEEGTATCGMHGRNKPEECISWKCYDPINHGTPGQRYKFMRVAVDILGTKREEDILSLIDPLRN